MADVRFKLSQYNVFHHEENIQYVWNTYSDALLKLDAVAQDYVNHFSGVDDGSKMFTILKNNGFAVNEFIDEFARVCFEEKQGFYSLDNYTMHVAIVPGLGCNCKCGYCFQTTQQALDLSGIMTPETAITTADFICHQLNTNPYVRKLDVVWFGGEPLLYIDIIDVISRRIMMFTQERNIKYSAGIPTNGCLLDKSVLTHLLELKVDNIQITLDGMCDLHCASKGISSNEFEKVIDNICLVSEVFSPLIRLNIPSNDSNEAILVTDYLLAQRGLSGKISLNFAYVCDYTLPNESADKAYIKYVDEYLRWADYVSEHYSNCINIPVPRRKTKHCGRINVHNVCIGPNGELHRCLHSIGDESMIIGNVRQGYFFNEADNLFFSVADDIKNRCSHCSFLPTCMGGCIKDDIKGIVRKSCIADKCKWMKLKLLEGGVHI